MTEHELALKLIETEGRCFVLFTNCLWCPMSEDNSGLFYDCYCGKNQAARLAWAVKYKEEFCREIIGKE